MNEPYVVFRAATLPFECVLRVGMEAGMYVYLWPETWTPSRLARPDFAFQYAEASHSTTLVTAHEMIKSYPNTDELTREKFADVYSYLSRKYGAMKMPTETSAATDLPAPTKAPVKKTASKTATKKKASGAKAPAKKVAAKKAVPAKKTAAKKVTKKVKVATEGGKRGAPTKFPLEAKITVLEKTNPKREGKRSFDEYELYKTCKTVGAYIDAGGTPGYLNYDVERGYIKVA